MVTAAQISDAQGPEGLDHKGEDAEAGSTVKDL